MISLRYPASCGVCGAALAPGERAEWDAATKTVTCAGCVAGPVIVAPSDAAGSSAQREYRRRAEKREASVRERHPRLGGLIMALTDEPQSTRAWAKGAAGERVVGSALDTLREVGAIVLHDRRVPRSSANIDHIVVARSGVWVVDAKSYTGRVEAVDVGGWFRTDVRLKVGGRDRTSLLAGVGKQCDIVEQVLEGEDVPVRGALCFTGADWGLFAKPFQLGGVVIAWPKALRDVIARPGSWSDETIARAAATIDARLRRAA